MQPLCIKKAIALVLLLALALTLPGCWNRRELNTLGIVGLMTVDRENELYKITCEVLVPSEAGKGGEKQPEEHYKLVQGSGITFFDSLRNVTLSFDRKLFFPHVSVYAFSEQLAKEGLAENLSFIFRDHEPRLATHIVIVKGAPAAEIMGVSGGLAKIPSRYLENTIKNYKANAKTLPTSVADFLKMYYADGIEPVVQTVRKRKKAQSGAAKEQDEYQLDVEGLAVFRQDVLAGYLDGVETRGYNFVRGKVASGVIAAPFGDAGRTVAVEILKADSKNQVEIKDGRIKFTVNVSMAGMIGEERTTANFKDPAVIAAVEQAAAQVVRQEIEHVVRKCQQELKADIFGFGQLVHQKHPAVWRQITDKNWNQVFSQADIAVNVQMAITRTGSTLSPINREENAK